jgi:hypothetical protein
MQAVSLARLVMLAALGGTACSDAHETILMTRPLPADAGQDAAPALNLGRCAGAGTECSEKPSVVAYVAGQTVECSETDLGEGTLAWSHAYDAVDCANPPCILRTADTRPRRDGSLDVLGALNQTGQLGDALWIAHLGPTGETLGASVRGYSLSSRIAEPKNFVPAGWDDAGNAFATVRNGDLNTAATFGFDVTRFRRSDDAEETLTSIRATFVSAYAAADGGFVTLSTWDDSGLDRDQTARTLPFRFDLSRYDAKGRLVWNQTKLSVVSPATSAELLDADVAGGATVVLDQIVEPPLPPPQRADKSYIDLQKQRVVRLDATGNVVWARDVPDNCSSVEHAVAPDRSLYRVRVPWKHIDAQYYEPDAPVLERMDASGRSLWTMNLPASEASASHTLTPRPDGSVVMRVASSDSPGSVMLRSVSADGLHCERFTVQCPAAGAGPCLEVPLRAAEDGHLYFSIGEIAGPS